MDNWWLHNPSSVMESSSMKLLWDFTIRTDRHLSHNRPDIVYISNRHKTAFLIDITIPGDAHKINEEQDKYTDLKIEVQRMWNVRGVVVATCDWNFGISFSVSGGESPYFEYFFTELLSPSYKRASC